MKSMSGSEIVPWEVTLNQLKEEGATDAAIQSAKTGEKIKAGIAKVIDEAKREFAEENGLAVEQLDEGDWWLEESGAPYQWHSALEWGTEA